MHAFERLTRILLQVLVVIWAVAVAPARGQVEPTAPDRLDRTVLPIAEPEVEPIPEIDARKATPPPRFEVKAPKNSPNVVIVLIDDMGFGVSETFGGPCNMPTLERLAGNGLKYSGFHTTALCSPTRMALLTGRNHHVANTGSVMETATAFPGNTEEAIRNHVYPLDDRRAERFNPAIAGRPDLMGPRTSLTLYDGMTGISENVFINIKNRSHSITAEIEVPQGGAEGVVIAQAARFAGWSLYMKDGRLHHVYNFGGLERYTVSSEKPLPPGRHSVRYEFNFDGGKPGSDGTSRLIVPDQNPTEARVERTMPFVFSGDEGVDVGMDNETLITEEYKERDNAFTGKIHRVLVEVK